MVEHEAVLDVVQDVHRVRHRRQAPRPTDLGRAGLLDQLIHSLAQPVGHLDLLGQIQHLQLVQELVDVAHAIAAGVFLRPLVAVLLGQDLNLYTGIFKHCYSRSPPYQPFYGWSLECQPAPSRGRPERRKPAVLPNHSQGPRILSTSLPTLTSAQAAEVDRLVAERFAIPVEWLMEAAGWQIARHCRGRTAVLCGKGNNGGDGLAAARHLSRWGRLHLVAALDRSAFEGAAAREAEALERSGVTIRSEIELGGADVLLDAIFGTGLSRPPEGKAADWIEAINASQQRVIAADLPSGLEADNGRALNPTVRAQLTVTLGLPKAGLLAMDGPAHAGEIWVADIGIPTEAYEAVGLKVQGTLFAVEDQVRL
ncbi:MAG: NAD(P)H-hydrate epimerase [Chloroflexi bacterium]|nr:MAG: NAD(P)H-hydrate epimerase [Chloroflexota bacterium]TMD52523.1 MAG: NAD(P)H-hydrate epimerase [Chloroflexota bacterium]